MRTPKGFANKAVVGIIFLSWVNLAHANIISSGLLNFNTDTSGLDFVTVHSSQTLQPGVMNLGLFLNDAINTLPYFESSTQGRFDLNDNLLCADMNIGLGLLPHLDAGLSLPSVVSQSVSNETVFHGEFSKRGLNEFRPNLRYHFLGDETWGLAVESSLNFNLTVNNPYAGTGGGPGLNLELIGDMTIKQVRLAANFGHRWTNSGQPIVGSPILPMGDQLIASAAATYLVPHTDTKVILEVFGSRPDDHTDSNSDRTASSLEMLLGFKHDFNINLSGHAGAGSELIKGTSSPDWRFYAGVNYAFGPLFSKTTDQFTPSYRDKAEHYVFQNLVFEFDSDELTDSSTELLKEIVNHLRTVRDYKKLIISGHTDSVGNSQYNMKLSEKRANAIRKILIDQYHFEADKIEAIGYGPNVPVADNGNFQSRQLNRRVEFDFER